MNNIIKSALLLIQNVPLDGLEKMGFKLVPEARQAYKMSSERALVLIIALCGVFLSLDAGVQAEIGINTVLSAICAIAGYGAVGRVISQKSIAGEEEKPEE